VVSCLRLAAKPRRPDPQNTGTHVNSIFVNYRTTDEPAAMAALIGKELKHQFGNDEVFLDVGSIDAGDDFEKKIIRGVRAAAVLLPVVGRNWLTVRSPDGRRALDSPNDWVGREIREALSAEIKIIPVLLEDVEPLKLEVLPDELRELARYQAIRVSYQTNERDIANLIVKLRQILPGQLPGLVRDLSGPSMIARESGRNYYAGRDMGIGE
jgi:hypothetical protein